MKNILFPTDFSNNAQSAVDYALKLYNTEPCTFYFLHSTYLLNPVSRTYITPHYVNELHKQGVKKLEKFVKQMEIGNNNIKHKFKSIISNKKLSIAIDTAIKQNDIELIIMGTKGITAAVEYFVGSNTVEVINKVKNSPILVIPDQQNFKTPKRIAFPTNFHRNYEVIELEPLKKMAKLYNAEINVMHINDEDNLSELQEYNKELLVGLLGDYKHSFHFYKNDSKKSTCIEKFIKDFEINMLAMVNYKHSLIENIIKEPVIKSLVFHPKIPMLIIPE